MMSCGLQSHIQPLPKISCCPEGISPSAEAESGEANVAWIPWENIHWSNWSSDYPRETPKSPGIPEAYWYLRPVEHLPRQPGMVPQQCWSIFCLCCRYLCLIPSALGYWWYHQRCLWACQPGVWSTLQEAANRVLALPHLPRVEHPVLLLKKAFHPCSRSR